MFKYLKTKNGKDNQVQVMERVVNNENVTSSEDGVISSKSSSENFKKIIDSIEPIDFESEVKKVWVGDEEYYTHAIILAVGSSPRLLNIPGEQKYYGKGVSTCATCDGAFYRDKTVAIAGGGDSAMEEGNFLTKFAK